MKNPKENWMSLEINRGKRKGLPVWLEPGL